MNLRAAATRVILSVYSGTSLAEALKTKTTHPHFSLRDQALIQALAYGTCRWFPRLEAIAKLLLKKPFDPKNNDLYILVLLGLYQIMDTRIPAYAAVAETVAATKHLKKPWAKGLINAVLRNYLREANTLTSKIDTELPGKYAHPHWLIEKIQKEWPADWEAILTANNQLPPFALRVNQQKISRDGYLQKLNVGVAEPIIETNTGIIFSSPVDVTEVPGFTEGEISVQDGAAQLAAELMELAPHQMVLDACAAPGGKTAHLLEIQPQLSLTALDRDNHRIQYIKDNLRRLTLSAKCLAADATTLATWWDGQPFDRILLDAPCSASGVIRRHPDIKLLRRATDIAKLAKTQLHLLNTLWQTLKPSGLLVYATCSIFSEENSSVIESFLANHPDATIQPIQSEWGKECVVGKQILPGMHNMDGFYFAKLKKKETDHAHRI